MRNTKMFYDKANVWKSFASGQKVLLYNFWLFLFSMKLRSQWSRPYIVWVTHPYSAMAIENSKNGNVSNKMNKD